MCCYLHICNHTDDRPTPIGPTEKRRTMTFYSGVDHEKIALRNNLSFIMRHLSIERRKEQLRGLCQLHPDLEQHFDAILGGWFNPDTLLAAS
jgi:hypothetical protein